MKKHGSNIIITHLLRGAVCTLLLYTLAWALPRALGQKEGNQSASKPERVAPARTVPALPATMCSRDWLAGPDLPSPTIRGVGVFFPATGNFYVMGGRTSDSSGSDLTHPFVYFPQSNVWGLFGSTYPDNQVNNMACGVLTDAGTPYIYCVGGSAAGAVTATGRVFRFDPVANTLTTVAAPWPGAGTTVLPGGFAVVQNKLYILGGFDINVAMTDTIWEFTPGTNAWVQKSAHLPVPLGYIPTATVSTPGGPRILTGGGSTGAVPVDSTNSFSYNPIADSITTIASIPRATGETRGVNVDNQLWVLGGGRQSPNPSNEVDIYDPVTNTWSIGSPFTTARRNFPAATDGTRIWLAGGYANDNLTPLASTEIFSCTRRMSCRHNPDNYIVNPIATGIVPGTTDTGNHADDETTNVPLPFSYGLYGHVFDSVNVSSNGNVQFNSDDDAYSNTCLPDTDFSYTIFPYWGDLRTDTGLSGCSGYAAGCGIFTSVSGTAPNRIFNIEFNTVYYDDNSQLAHFEVRLYEGQARFDVIYGQIDRGTAAATAGVQKDETNYTQYFCNGLGAPLLFPTSYTICPVVSSDFNDDSNPDLVLYNISTRGTAVWYLNNHSFAGSAYGPTLPPGWRVIDTADFNVDGNPDYALFNSSTRQTAIWYLHGTSFSSSAYGPTPPPGWALIAVRDFNNDGHPDFVLYNATTRQTAIWFLNNNAFTSSSYGPTLPSGWSLAGVGDFNRDGQPDYALFNASTRQTAIWYLNGTSFSGSAYGPTIASGYGLIGVADFDINAKPDFLLFKATTRQTAIWYLNNNSFVGSAYGPTPPPGWMIVAP